MLKANGTRNKRPVGRTRDPLANLNILSAGQTITMNVCVRPARSLVIKIYCNTGGEPTQLGGVIMQDGQLTNYCKGSGRDLFLGIVSVFACGD
jgi:hypothetical protein